LVITAIVRMTEGKGRILAVPKLVRLLRRFIQAQLARPERQFSIGPRGLAWDEDDH
jgi:hypothetical protein